MYGKFMASINLVESFQEFKDAENIDRPTLMKVMEDEFKTLIRKKYGSDENFDEIAKELNIQHLVGNRIPAGATIH